MLLMNTEKIIRYCLQTVAAYKKKDYRYCLQTVAAYKKKEKGLDVLFLF